MSSNNSIGFNTLKQQRLMSLTCLINPEQDKSFEYLCKFFKYTKVQNLKILKKITVDDLIKQEKIYHDMILNPAEHNVSRLNSWVNYILWIKKLFTKEDVRFFLVLENFTKSTTNEKEFYTQIEFVEHWIAYLDMCADDIEVMKYMKKNDICTRNTFFYQSMAILYEKSHEFQNANNAYLEGFDKRIENLESLQVSYKLFEERMENRINREINSSVFNSEIINHYIHNELKKTNQNIHETGVFNSNNKRLRNFHNDISSNLNFVIKKKKIEFIEDYPNPSGSIQEGIHSTIKYGQIPIFVDEPFRKNVITKGTKLVEIYSVLVKFLLEKDEMFKIQNQNFLKKLKDDYLKKPVSWLNGLRINPDKILYEEGGGIKMVESRENNDKEVNLPHKTTIPKLNDQIFEKKNAESNQINELTNNLNNINYIQREKKVDDVVNKMMKDIKVNNESVNDEFKKAEIPILKQPDKSIKNEIPVIKQPDKTIKNEIPIIKQLDKSIDNLEKTINPIEKKEKINNDITESQNIPKTSADTIQLQDGNKYRIMRVENQNKLQMDFAMMKQKLFNQNNKKEYFTLEEIRAQVYFENLRKKEKKEQDIKNKRKTIIFKIDSDGDMCLSSDEEKEMASDTEFNTNINLNKNTSIPAKSDLPSIKASTIPKENILVDSKANLVKTLPSHTTNLHQAGRLKDKPVQENPYQNTNLNLFNYSMTIEEINDKIKEATKMFENGLINIETRDNLYNHLEEKILQIEKLEQEQQKSKKLKINSFNELVEKEEKGFVKPLDNPFIKQKNNSNTISNINSKVDSDLISYLEPIGSKHQKQIENPHNQIKHPQQIIKNNNQVNNHNNIPHLNPLMELPHSILKKTADETIFSNVSRSLDFTNIKLIDSSVKTNENKIPFSSLFLIENANNKKQQKKEDFSISFDSEHSYMFPNPFDNTPYKEDNFFNEATPPKERNRHLHRALNNIKESPMLNKKNYLEEDLKIKEDSISKIHSINHINHINLQLINNNNSLKINEDKNFTDLNKILKEGNKKIKQSVITDSEEDNESEEEKKMKLAKLFGDAFGMSKRERHEPPLNFGYGLSSITEKTTENTYLSDDSIIIRKII